jgi:hypothetical protein
MSFGAILVVCALESQGQSGITSVTPDETAIYAAILDSPDLRESMSRPLIADKTSTFACDTSICNGMSIGGCNGLRGMNETLAARMAIVRRDLPKVDDSTVAAFERENQKCASIGHNISSHSDYHLFDDSDISKTWKYSTIVYFSRVGFDGGHTRALVNVGLMSADRVELSRGFYVLLENHGGTWAFAGTSAVWALNQPN